MSISPRAAKKKALTSTDSVMKVEELERLKGYTSIRSNTLCMEYITRHLNGKPFNPSTVAWTAISLYEAGRIDGIREERKRRHVQ